MKGFIIHSVLVFIFISLPIYGEKKGNFIKLNDWELSLDNGKSWTTSKPVPWEFPKNVGGQGIGHNGFGIYKTKFTLPENFTDEEIAFYTDCIDDSDEEFLNGKKIGKFGRFPDEIFKSAARIARLSPLPKQFLKNGENEIRIVVYDFSGLGGFCYSQTPVIGSFSTLQEKERNHRILNDLPRSVLLVILLLLTIRFLFLFFENYSFIDKKEFFLSIIFPYTYIFKNTLYYKPTFRTQLAFRALLTVIFCFMSMLFLLNETTYKYLLFDSEKFFFKIPTIGFVLGEIALVHIFYPDVFRNPNWIQFSTIETFVRKISSFISHPLIAVALFIYLIFLSPENVWGNFTLFGISILFFILFILFLMTFLNLTSSFKYISNKKKRNAIQKEIFLRLFIFISLLVGFVFWFLFTNFLISYSFLVMILFFQGYLWFANMFLLKSRIILPIVPTKRMPISLLLQEEYGLSEKEAEICELILSDRSSEEIRKILKIQLSTLKVHRKFIYRKTIEKHKDKSSRSKTNDKQRQLLNFLTKLKKK